MHRLSWADLVCKLESYWVRYKTEASDKTIKEWLRQKGFQDKAIRRLSPSSQVIEFLLLNLNTFNYHKYTHTFLNRKTIAAMIYYRFFFIKGCFLNLVNILNRSSLEVWSRAAIK